MDEWSVGELLQQVASDFLDPVRQTLSDEKDLENIRRIMLKRASDRLTELRKREQSQIRKAMLGLSLFGGFFLLLFISDVLIHFFTDYGSSREAQGVLVGIPLSAVRR